MTDAQTLALLQNLSDQLDGELQFSSLTKSIYSTDASSYQEMPLAIAFPTSNRDIALLIRFANKHQIGIIPRTAGTSLAGQVVGSGIVVDVSREFTEIIEINPTEGWVRVQPGVVRDELNLALKPHGLMFGPETSSSNRAMIGGMVGNNSCGSNSIVYGSTRDHVLEIHGFLADASPASFSALSADKFEEKCMLSNRSMESNLYRSTKCLLGDPEAQAEIGRQFPKPEIKRRNTGYALDLLIDSKALNEQSQRPFDFCRLICGSEGTLFFSTEIKLNCIPLPPPISALQCAHFSSVRDALRATQVAVKHAVYAVELVDHFIVEGALRNIEQRRNADFVQGHPQAILVTEFRGDSISDVNQQANRLESELTGLGLGDAYPVLIGDDSRKVWELRKSGLGVVSNVPGDEKPVAVIEDTAVSVDDLPEFIADFNRLLKEKFDLNCVHYAHAGSGELHLRPILNLKTADGNRMFREIASDVADLVKRYRGSLSGEHGDGRLRGEFLERMIGAKNFELVQNIKKLWDPNNIFNPGKIVNTPPMNSQLRFSPNQSQPNPETVFSFETEQGIGRAAELCSGSGDCRKSHLIGGTMCPSYMATKDEADSTRARANMLRHALTHPIDQGRPFDNPDLKQVMDLCLSCKGCKRECPSNVDVSKMKAEFLQGYYDVHGIPKRAQRIASFSSIMNLASKMPWAYNTLVTRQPFSALIKNMMGFSTSRSIPKLSHQTFRSWFGKHTPHSNAGRLGAVYLFCDEFTNFTDIEIGIAGVELLERIGYSVEIPFHVESGRGAMSQGLLRQAREFANQNVQMLSTIVSDDRPLIGLEPSTILGFRDEYPNLVSPRLRRQAKTLANHVLMIDEFIEKQIDDHKLDNSQFTTTPQTIRLHGHCHQKAIASLKPTIRMLSLPCNYNVRLIPSGCCGMAGAFGFEKEHYDVSMQIGELVLFPTIRNEVEDVIIAAPGTSCRHQILDGTGRQAFHPVQILNEALRDR